MHVYIYLYVCICIPIFEYLLIYRQTKFVMNKVLRLFSTRNAVKYACNWSSASRELGLYNAEVCVPIFILCIYRYIYLYMYIYIYTHIHTYIHIHICVCDTYTHIYIHL